MIPVQEGLFPGDLDLLEQAVVAKPATVSIGQTVTVGIPFQAPTSPSLLADVFVLVPPPERTTVANFQGSPSPRSGASLFAGRCPSGTAPVGPSPLAATAFGSLSGT